MLRRSFWLVATAAVGSFAVAGSAGADGDLQGQRLIVTQEGLFGGQVTAIDGGGSRAARVQLQIQPGLNGGVAVSRDGTRFAYVQSVSEYPPGLPARIRARLPTQPEAELRFGSFLRDTSATIGLGTTSLELVATHPLAAGPGRPAWSPSGRWIVFTHPRRGQLHLYLTSTGGRGALRAVTSGPGRDLDPSWSPDGRTIVFERHLGSEASLFSVRPDGSALRRLTFWRGRTIFPDFSPDGGSLTFASDVTGTFQLYVLSLGSGKLRRITFDSGDDTRPAWSPDGRSIAFSSDRDGDDDVYLVDPRGRHERKLTHNASEDRVQGWQALRDARVPVIRALPGSVRAGRSARLRFTLRDSSPYVRVLAAAIFRSSQNGLREAVVSTRSRLHVIRASARDLVPYGDDENASAKRPTAFRFCVIAVDGWGNTSRPSCARIRLR